MAQLHLAEADQSNIPGLHRGVIVLPIRTAEDQVVCPDAVNESS